MHTDEVRCLIFHVSLVHRRAVEFSFTNIFFQNNPLEYGGTNLKYSQIFTYSSLLMSSLDISCRVGHKKGLKKGLIC